MTSSARDKRTMREPEAGISASLLRIRIITILGDKLRLLTILTLLVSLATFLAGTHWVLELTSHFRVQYLAASVFCWLGLIAFRDWRWSLVGLLCLLLNGWAVLPWYVDLAPQKADSDATHLRVMLANVLTSNENTAALLERVESEAPDLLALQEIDDRWVGELRELNRSYPYSKVIPRGDNFGIGLWSRFPLTAVEELTLSKAEVPSIYAQLEITGRTVSILTTHPVPPGSKAGFDERNAQLSALGSLVRQSSTPTILLGDLNVTMWSPYYAKLIRDSGLVNTRRGFGVLPTWPTQMPILKIPLDHCLVSPSIAVRGIRTGKSIGSDHLPLIIDLTISPER